MILLLLFSFILSFFLLKGKAQVTPSYYLKWSVSSGDTLWKIAESSLPKGRDIRCYISEIREWNHLSSSVIKEGQTLQIPIYDSDNTVQTAVR
jgi:LysM repeat protein